MCTVFCSVCVAPGFPMQGFPNGYPGYPISADSSQPSLTNDHRHSLMGLDDQVRTNTCLGTHTIATNSIWTLKHIALATTYQTNQIMVDLFSKNKTTSAIIVYVIPCLYDFLCPVEQKGNNFQCFCPYSESHWGPKWHWTNMRINDDKIVIFGWTNPLTNSSHILVDLFSKVTTDSSH